MRAVLAFYRQRVVDPESARTARTPSCGIGPFLWSRDGTVNPPGLMLDVSTTHRQVASPSGSSSRPTWGMDFTTDLAAGGGIVFRLRPPFELSAEPKAGTASGAVSFTVNRNAAAPRHDDHRRQRR